MKVKVVSMDLSTSSAVAINGQQQTPSLVLAAREVLTQGAHLVEQQSDENYSAIVANPFHASIGQHFRHALEHFHCLLQGTACGEVNYDTRERNPRIENEPAFAVAATRRVLQELGNWTESTLLEQCNTTSTVAYTSNAPFAISSNLGRELAYCIGHAIHHYAIIRLLCSHLGVQVPKEFGYAPSTLKFQSGTAAD